MKRESRLHTTAIACSRRPAAYVSSTAVTGESVTVISACFDSYSSLMKVEMVDCSDTTSASVSLASSPSTCAALVAA